MSWIHGVEVRVTKTRHGGSRVWLAERPPWWSHLEWWRYRWNCLRCETSWRADDAQAAAYARFAREIMFREGMRDGFFGW